jgi:hypothetical protein
MYKQLCLRRLLLFLIGTAAIVKHPIGLQGSTETEIPVAP